MKNVIDLIFYPVHKRTKNRNSDDAKLLTMAIYYLLNFGKSSVSVKSSITVQ